MDQNTPARSPNVGDIRWLGAKSVMLLCQTCQHRQVANIELLPPGARAFVVTIEALTPNS